MYAVLSILAYLMLPAFLLAVPVSVMGVWRQRVWWPIVGALMAAPASLYLAGTPRFRWVGLFPILCHLGAAVAARYRQRWLGLLLLLPIPLFLGWFYWDMAGEGSAPIPPGPRITAADTLVPIAPAAWCGETAAGRDCTSVPDQVVKRSGMVPTEVPPGAKLHFQFDVKPQFWDVFAWDSGRPVKQAVDRADSVTVPATPGLYVYDVSARWHQGGDHWVIYLQVN